MTPKTSAWPVGFLAVLPLTALSCRAPPHCIRESRLTQGDAELGSQIWPHAETETSDLASEYSCGLITEGESPRR